MKPGAGAFPGRRASHDSGKFSDQPAYLSSSRPAVLEGSISVAEDLLTHSLLPGCPLEFLTQEVWG